MKSLVRVLKRLSLVALGALPCLGLAQTGNISGQVSLAGQGGLDGVNIRVLESGRTVSTDRYGQYNVPNLAEGSYTLEFSYLGLDTQSRQAEVRAGETTTLDLQFYDNVVELDPLVVSASLSSEAQALNQQRTAETFSNIVAADALGRFPDQNAAEALGRVPGIAIDRDQGEGRYVVIRGVDKNLNSFAVDGVQLASPKNDERAVLMDIVPSDVLQTLEVYKVVSPDQPADGIGGYVNIRTPSAFDAGETVARLQVQGNYNDLAGKWGERINATYGDLFNDETLGLMIALSYDKREIASDNNEADSWSLEDGADGEEVWVTETLEYREYNLSRERVGATANLEWKPSDTQLLYIRANFSQYEDHEYRDRVVFDFGDASLVEDETTANLVTFSAEEEDDDVEFGVESLLKDRTETLKLWGVSLGGQSRLDNWTLDYKASYSFADEETPDDFEVTYELDDADEGVIAYSTSERWHPVVTSVEGADFTDASEYEFDSIEDSDQTVEEDAWTLQGDARYDLEISRPAFVKFGGLFRSKEKTNDVTVTTYEDTPANESLADVLGSFDYPYGNFPFISHSFGDFFSENRANFGEIEEEEDDSLVEDFESSEDVLAAYLMGGIEFGSHSLRAGVRMEQTTFETNGWQVSYEPDPEDEEELIRLDPVEVQVEKDYTNWLPGILYTYRASDQLVVRGSITNTIARPLWAQNSAYIVDEAGEAEAGNPDLDPYESMNFDASVEYYTDGLGVLYGALFYKRIDSFIFEQTLEDASFNGVEYDELTTYHNGDDAYIMGMELAYQQTLTFLPDPLDGLGFLVNGTFSTSDAQYSFNGLDTRDIHLPGQSNTVLNVALSYEKYGFFFRVAASVRSKYLDELGGEDMSEDRYIKDYMSVDVSTAYNINSNLSVYANFINVTNEPLRAYWGESGRIAQFEEYGMTIQVGAKWNY